MLRKLLSRMAKRRITGMDDSQAEMRAALIMRYRDVQKACREIETIIDLPPGQLAKRYMSSILAEQHDAVWWQDNSGYLAEAWFIFEYGCANGMIRRPETSAQTDAELFIIEPEMAEHGGVVRLRIIRKVGRPDCGVIWLEYMQADDVFRDLVRTMKYTSKDERFGRRIDETCGGIVERAVEAAVSLLQHGYCVCMEEPLLKERILREEYEPEHLYWVVEGSSVDKLELRYPRDRQLHEYVYKAGGRWNGKAVEISVCDSHLLDDLIRLYGFRVTEGAKLRMEAWRDTLEHATIYRSRKRKDAQSEAPMVDRFKEMMDRRSKRIDDLYEDDE